MTRSRRNRAKCKLCGSIIESYHSTDYVTCKCSAIAVDGGDAMYCFAQDFDNFLRVDDNDNEIVPKVIAKLDEDSIESPKDPIHTKLTKVELIKMLDDMIENVDRLPQAAMTAPISHYDYYSLMLLLSSLFKAT